MSSLFLVLDTSTALVRLKLQHLAGPQGIFRRCLTSLFEGDGRL